MDNQPTGRMERARIAGEIVVLELESAAPSTDSNRETRSPEGASSASRSGSQPTWLRVLSTMLTERASRTPSSTLRRSSTRKRPPRTVWQVMSDSGWSAGKRYTKRNSLVTPRVEELLSIARVAKIQPVQYVTRVARELAREAT